MINNSRCCISFMIAIISIILGIIVGFVSFGTAIVGIITALWFAFSIGIGAFLLVTLLAVYVHGKEHFCCMKKSGAALSIGAIGTVILSIVALAISIVTGSVGVSILLGLITFFLVFTILNALRLSLCLVRVD